MLEVHVTRTVGIPRAAEWGIFHPFSKATTVQEKECTVDQTVLQARIPTELKLVTLCMYFKVLNKPLHSVM